MVQLQSLRRQCLSLQSQSFVKTIRSLSTSPSPQNAPSSTAKSLSATGPTTKKPHGIDPQWLTMTKRRLGRCMMFGLRPSQIQESGELLQQIARDWRELVAGSEGYLTDALRRGLFKQAVAWGEMDSMVRHVNNVTYARYAETARVYFTRNFAMHIDPAHKKEWMNLVSSRGIGLIMRSIKIDYKFPMTYPDQVTVYHKLVHDPAAPDASPYAFQLQAIILSEARFRPAARVHEDLVTYDYKQAKKTALPPFLFEQLKKTWELQEQAKEYWRQRILDIEARVRALEVESWDREDAVEDTGSARK